FRTCRLPRCRWGEGRRRRRGPGAPGSTSLGAGLAFLLDRTLGGVPNAFEAVRVLVHRAVRTDLRGGFAEEFLVEAAQNDVRLLVVSDDGGDAFGELVDDR